MKDGKIMSISKKIKIDLGCSVSKRENFIGIDSFPAPGVDIVLDIMKNNLPFPDQSVDHVLLSHTLEHLGTMAEPPLHLFREISRVCCDGAIFEIWSPYLFHNDAFIYGHVTYFTEEIWLHFCVQHPEFWKESLGNVQWLLKQVNYMVPERVEKELRRNGFSVDFAIKYFKGVVKEFGVFIEISRKAENKSVSLIKTYSNSRSGKQFQLENKGLRGFFGKIKKIFKK